jgi:hypothetical protein
MHIPISQELYVYYNSPIKMARVPDRVNPPFIINRQFISEGGLQNSDDGPINYNLYRSQ